MPPTRPSPFSLHAWLLASRPRTLPAAISPVIAGAGVAIYTHEFRLLPVLAALVAAVLIQIGANLANDAYDYLRGADTPARLGPTRVTHAGLLTMQQVLAGMWAVFALAALVGVYLALVGGWPVVLIGLLCIAAAIAYTAGPFPLAYLGLGEVFAFLFFGLIAVGGTYYVQAKTIEPIALWVGVPLGFLVAAILVVNNLRDISEDRTAGKRTIAVRLGAGATRTEYLLLLAGAFAAPPLMVLAGIAPWPILVAWLALPQAAGVLHIVQREEGRALNRALAATAGLELLYSLLISVGFAAGSLIR